MKSRFGEKNGQGYPGKPSTRTDVQDIRARLKRNKPCNPQRMENMIQIKIIDIFPGNDVDLCVPFLIERLESGELFFLTIGQIWEIGEYEFSRHGTNEI